MDKSNANSEKIFDNNNGNIETIKNIPQMKILDLSIILYLHHCSEFIIHYSYCSIRLKTLRSGQYGINNENNKLILCCFKIFLVFF